MNAPAIELLENEPRDRFAVGVAVLVVVTTLVAAGIGLLFVRGSNEADVAAATALRSALAASSTSVDADHRVDEALTRLQLAREHDARGRSALEAATLGAAGQERRWDARRWTSLARASERSLRAPLGDGEPLLDITAAGPEGAEQDAYFPYAFRQKAHQAVHVALAQRDEANSQGAEWGKRNASYAAILTLLAVALYLYGFALTPHGRPLRGLFAAVATTFLFLGVMFGPVRAVSSPHATSESAAGDYARGVVAQRAGTHRRDYLQAEAYLTRAIAERPDFAEAYVERSQARFMAGSPQFVGAPSLSTAEALERGLSDIRMARALGVRTSTTLGGQGFDLFVIGMRTHRPELLQESLAITREALAARGGDDPWLRLNLAVNLLAVGRVAEAEADYRRGLAGVLRRADGAETSLVSGALTDLELVAEHGSLDRLGDVRRMKELIVGSVNRRRVGMPGSDTAPVEVAVDVTSNRASVSVMPKGKGDEPTISVQWYHDEPGGLGWSNVEQLQQMAWTRAQARDYMINSTYVAFAKRCLPSGRYRAEVYDDGRLIASGSDTYDGEDVAAVVDQDHAIVGCRPRSWRPRRGGSPLVRSYLGPKGRGGLHLLRLDGGRDTQRASRRTIERLLRSVARVPGDPPRHYYSGPRHVFGHSGWEHGYLHGEGSLQAATAVDADGSMLVAIVFARDYDRAAAVLSSLEGTYGVASRDAS